MTWLWLRCDNIDNSETSTLSSLVAPEVVGKKRHDATRPPSQYKDRFVGIGLRIIKMRRSSDRLIFIMEIPILVTHHLYIETAPVDIMTTLGCQGMVADFSIYISSVHSTYMYKLCQVTFSKLLIKPPNIIKRGDAIRIYLWEQIHFSATKALNLVWDGLWIARYTMKTAVLSKPHVALIRVEPFDHGLIMYAGGITSEVPEGIPTNGTFYWGITKKTVFLRH